MSLNRSFVFLRYPETHLDDPRNPDDFLRNPNAATKVVQSLKKMGIKYFLILPGRWPTLDDYRIIGRAIEAAGLQFFSYEGWSWEDYTIDDGGHFDSAKYLRNWVNPFLVPLKNEFPATFTGFHFKDEPGLAHLDGLGELNTCLKSQPEFQGMRVFLNLFPIHATFASLSGLVKITEETKDSTLVTDLLSSRRPSEFGVDCSTDAIVDYKAAREMAISYGTYVRRATEKIKPDYLCFDLYPFSDDLAHCNAARELTMSENLSIISANARLAGITPVAYLQNVQHKNDFYANFHHLRWFTSWALAFGIREFANFISHGSVIADNGLLETGLLDSQNNETKLGVDQLRVFGFIRHIQHKVAPLSYNRFVAPFIGVNSGDIVGWLPSSEVLAGEYRSSIANQVMVFFARRPIEGTIQTSVGLNAWYRKIEQLDVVTGRWNLVARSINSIQLTLKDYPGALYRLTK